MSKADIERIVAQGESQTLEFERSTGQLTRAGETLCGMLNGSGGMVMVGVTDSGEVVGQVVADSTLQKVAAMLRDFEPQAPIRVERVPIEGDREILVLHAQPSPGLGPWTYRGRAYQRVGPTTSTMPQAEYLRYFLDRGQGVTEWEKMLAPEGMIDDLDHQEILRTVRLGIQAGRLPEDTGSSIPDILDRFPLRRDGRLNNAAMVLFGKPALHFPQCCIRLARFDGTTKDEFIDNRQEMGGAFFLLEEAMTFFRRHLSIAGRFVPGRIERVDTPEYPVFALREAVVNALIHRSYVNAGGAVSVAIFDDRLEVWSEGLLPFGQQPEELTKPHTSRPRNPVIAGVFYRRGLIEAWGRGTQRIVALCVEAGLPEPEFGQLAGAVWVRFWPGRTTSVHIKTDDRLTHRQRAILELMKRREAMALREIRAKLDSPPTARTIQRDLKRLERLGLVLMEGRGRGAVYRLTTDNSDTE